MYKHNKIRELDDFFVELNNRPDKAVYFYRINAYTEEVGAFIQKYYKAAGAAGMVIEGKIPNPDERNLSYYNEIMGTDFRLDLEFVRSQLKKWLPGMNAGQQEDVASALYHALVLLQKDGKNDNMLKNAYIKYMCWLYYRFRGFVNQLGANRVPKILYEGTVRNSELILFSILSAAGCDVLLLQYTGDSEYHKMDPDSVKSDNLELPDMKPFPEYFNIKWIRERVKSASFGERLYGKAPAIQRCTNAWMEGSVLENIRKTTAVRGKDPQLFYNCYCRINGVEDKLLYLNELYQLQLELKKDKRKLVIVDGKIPQPTTSEIALISRKSYTRQEELFMDLVTNIRYPANMELQRLMIKAFLDVMLAEAGNPEHNINKLLNKAVYLLCWLKRYQGLLFSDWKETEVACFIYMGGCKNKNEALFLKMLAGLPVDLLILNPDLNAKCCLEDELLYEENYVNSLVVEQYPKEDSEVHIGTAAYHAERELDTMMYQDSGMYRNHQYAKANTITLQTMYEEIPLIWKEEVKYRPNFSTVDEIANVPVLFAKVSGVKDGLLEEYWASIKELITEDTYVIQKVPFIESAAGNPMKAYVTEFFKNGRLCREKIKNHLAYPYAFLREEVQNHMLDKLQLLIDQKLLKGTFENGTEYTIIATILNLDKTIVRLIQRFDFTKKNPKLIYINTGEQMISLEDSILVAFLNLVGFDVLFFVPTGYQNVEKYFNKKLLEEHQIGEYIYDLQVPDLAKFSSNKRLKWFEKIFKKGVS